MSCEAKVIWAHSIGYEYCAGAPTIRLMCQNHGLVHQFQPRDVVLLRHHEVQTLLRNHWNEHLKLFPEPTTKPVVIGRRKLAL